MVKGTTDISRRGKTARVWRNAWGATQNIQVGRTSETKDERQGGGRYTSKMTRKKEIKSSNTGQGNPRSGTYKSSTGRKTKWYTGGGF